MPRPLNKCSGLMGKALAAMLLIVSLFLSPPLPAQTNSSLVEGTVEDPSGAVIPDCQVILVSMETGGSFSTRSNDAGVYIFPSVPPGIYSLKVSKEGFKSYSVTDFKITVSQSVTQNVALELGAASQTVVVEEKGSAPLLEPSSNELGTLIEAISVQKLPLNGRDFLQLGLLSGATQDSGTLVSDFLTLQTGHPDRTITIAGNEQDLTGFLVNGISTAGSRLGQSSLNISIAAIDQFKVREGFFLPSPGADPGVISVVTKAGTNHLHGEVFEFVRNNVFDGRNFFSPESQPGPFRRNQFGGAVGGPIRRNRLFFFAHYEGHRQVLSDTVQAFTPSEKMFKGDFSEILPTKIYDPNTYDAATGQRQAFPDNIIPADRINSMADKLLAYYLAGSSYNTRPLNVSGDPRTTDRSDQFGGRVDVNLGANTTLFGQYVREDSPVVDNGLFPVSGYVYPLNTQLAMVQLTTTLSAHLVNEFRLGWTRPSLFYGGVSQLGLQNRIGFTGTADKNGPPGVNLNGFSSFGTSQSVIGNIDEQYQMHEAINYLQGNHEIKFGAGLFYIRNVEESANFNARGTVNFSSVFTAQLAPNAAGQLAPMLGTGDSFADFLLGMPTSGSVTSMPRTHFRWTQLEPYFQDTWKLRPGLTINAGLGWQMATPPRPSGNDAGYPHAFNFETGLVEYAALGQVNPAIYKTDYNNFAPRLGIAWEPRFVKRTVVRAGAGIYYPSEASLYQLFGITAPGISIVQSISNSQFQPTPTYLLGQNVFPPISQETITPEFAQNLTGSIFALDTGLRTPYVAQWAFAIQHTFTQNNLVEINYLGSQSRKLPNRWNIDDCSAPNSMACTSSVVPYPRYTYVFYAADEAMSNYNAFVLKFQREFSHGLGFTANYTWSKVLSSTMQGGANSPLNQMASCRRCDKGMAGFNVPQRLVTSTVWELPLGKGKRFLTGISPIWERVLGGWALDTIATFSQGNPFTVQAPNLTADPLTSVRANRLCNGRSDLARSNVRTIGLYWIQPSCFASPAAGYFGDSGANIITGPGVNNWDLAIEKNTLFRERAELQFRAELFNAWNHAQFENPDNTVGDANFGRITSARAAREVQLSLKLLW